MVQVGTPGAKKGLFSVEKLRASGLGGSLVHELRVHFESVPSLHTPPPLGLVFISGVAATAKSLQSCPCPTLCDPIDGSPPGSPVPGILQASILEWVAISFSRVGGLQK